MPTHAQLELLSAIRNGQAYDKRNLRYEPASGRVWLYGRPVAQLLPDGSLRATLAGWNTNTSRQLVNALARERLGRNVLTTENYRVLVDGRPVDVREWFTVARRGPETGLEGASRDRGHSGPPETTKPA